MKIAIAGMGYVGLSQAVLLAQHNSVCVVDVAAEKVDMLNRGISPIQDSYLDAYLNKPHLRLRATLDPEDGYSGAEYVVIAVPTDFNPRENAFDTAMVESVIRQVLRYAPEAVMVIKSTVPVGFTQSMQSKYPAGHILVSPEFLREGKALYDNLYPSRIIVGTDLADPVLTEQAHAFARLLQEDMPTLQKYEKRLTALEEALMQDQAQDLDKKLFRIRRELSVFAAYYEQLDDLFAALSDETEESDAHASRLFDRLTGRAQRLLSATELEKEYALQLREMHQTQLDMRQNQIMKILTIVTTVFLPLSLIAGWYGMNFVNMPELTAQHGYLAVCIISVVCIIVELVIFKWKKWL